jgi:hypothetical protein
MFGNNTNKSKLHIKLTECLLQFRSETFIFLTPFQSITKVLPVGLYGCKACSLTLLEEQRLTTFENRVLRRIFGQVMEVWEKLHKEQLHNLFSSPNIIKVTKSKSIR